MPALLVDAQIASIFWGDVPIPIDCGWIKSTVNPLRGRVGISNAPTMTPGPRQNNIVPFSRWTNHRRLSVNNVTTMTSIWETWRSLTPMGFPPSKNPWQRQATPRLSDHRSDTFAPPPSGTFAPYSSDTFAPSSSYRPLWL